MKNYTIYLLSFIFIFTTTGCFKDLDTIPLDQDIITASTVYDDPSAYEKVLAKLYGGFAVSGQEGPAGQPDIEGGDEGFGQYLRALWYHQELCTDEAVVGWNDQTIFDFHDLDWTSTDNFTFNFYSRIFYQIPLCNEFLRETTPEKLSDRNVDSNLQNEIQGFRAEARFIRALSYYHALDHFRNVPFVTEEDAIGTFFPEQISGSELFDYIESELLDIENEIAPARTNVYARADQGAVWTLLAKLYLNAEVYNNTNRYNDCLTYCEKVINSGYTLEEVYGDLFLADNHNSNEIIFPIAFDGINTRTYGGTTFIINAAIGGSLNPSDQGMSSGWSGTRTTKQLVEKFGELGGKVIEPNPGNTNSYAKVYVPGSFQDFDFSDTNNSLSSIENDKIYEGHKYFPEPNTEFRIATIPSENGPPSLGDNNGDGTLEIAGDNIIVNDPGFYHISVNLNNNTYELEKREWALVGDAAAGWDNDILFTFDEDLNALKLTVSLNEGEIKFRANRSNDINLGDTDADALLEYNGDNIKIEKSGAYEILLFVNRPDYTYEIKFASFDIRGDFYSSGQNLEIDDLSLFTDGYAVTKFKNINSDGTPGSDGDYADTDFPMFRLADVYLMASEAIVRNNGDLSKATDYFNRVRARGYGNSTAANITESQLNLETLIEERGKELYWECHRRTDLIRFGLFTSNEYLWAWKGGVKEGRGVEDFRKIYPIPSSDIGANPNLVQNEGY